MTESRGRRSGSNGLEALFSESASVFNRIFLKFIYLSRLVPIFPLTRVIRHVFEEYSGFSCGINDRIGKTIVL